MIVPPGMELQKYTRPDEMVFNISGLSDHGKITMPLQGARTDTISNMRIFVHFPTAGIMNGANEPQVDASSGLTQVVGWGTYYRFQLPSKDHGPDVDDNDYTCRFVDFKNRKIALFKGTRNELYRKAFSATGIVPKKDAPGDFDQKYEFVLVRPHMEAAMSSAILCTKPGAETGELLMAYPQTGISTSQTTETMKMQLRVYLGCALYEPENVLVVPDVQFDGLLHGHGGVVAGKTGQPDEFDTKDHDLFVAIIHKGGDVNFEVDSKDAGFVNIDSNDMRAPDYNVYDALFKDQENHPAILYQGATFNKDKKIEDTNTGHLGVLDCLQGCDRLDGLQTFTNIPEISK